MSPALIIRLVILLNYLRSIFEQIIMKKQDFTFRELPPPPLLKIFTISHPKQELIFEHWKHLFSAIEWEVEPEVRILCIVYKSAAQISLMSFQDGCLLYQRKFKIAYGQVQQITCIKVHPITIRNQNQKKRQLVTIIGFQDGCIELYHLSISTKNIVLKKIYSIEADNKQPVTNLAIGRGHLFASRLHQVQVYKDCMSIAASFILNLENPKGPVQFRCGSRCLSLKQMGSGMTLSLSMGKNTLHVFNQSEGSKSFLLDGFQQYGTILDSMTFILELLGQNLVIGDTNDKLKIIYKKRKLVQRFSGFKNFCSDAYYRLFQSSQQLWIADLNGCITYLQRAVDSKGEPKPNPSIKMMDAQIHFNTKIIDSGIKKLMVCGKIMIILDTQSNIHLFDVVRNEGGNNQNQIDIESVEQDNSSQNNQ